MDSPFFIVIQFEPIPIGSVARKTYRFDHRFKDDDTIKIRPIEVGNKYCFFKIKLAKGKPNRNTEIQISYCPVIVHAKNWSHFEITDDFEHLKYILSVYGECIAPNVTCSVRQLTFLQIPKHNEVSKIFEIKNTSTIDAIYQWDIDVNQSVFKVDTVAGVIPAKKYINVTVKFYPLERGIYSAQLPMLILNHKPIIIDIVGIFLLHTEVDFEKSPLSRYPIPIMAAFDYEGYMWDSTNVIFNEPPPVSITDTFFDFRYLNTTGNDEHFASNTFTITNHIENEIFIKWESDNNDIFKITPQEIFLASQKSALFECTFKPKEPCKLYGSVLNGMVFWKKETDITPYLNVPIPFRIYVTGNPFPPSSGGWLPQAELHPNKLFFPPCIPSMSSYATLQIKRYGHLPVTFKFCYPSKTHFSVKPMCGIITGDYQIVVIQFCPNNNKHIYYNEQWKVELNGREEHNLMLELQGYLEYPNIVVGYENIVEFPTLYPKCEVGAFVKMLNTTNHCLRYKYIIPPEFQKNLWISVPFGELAANECTQNEWKWYCDLDTPEKIEIQLETFALQYATCPIGVPVISYVQIFGKCEESFLCALPNQHSFYECLYGVETSTMFKLFNFGETTIHFELVYRPSEFEIDDSELDVTISPVFGDVLPKSSQEIQLTICPKTVDYHNFTITYNVRKNIYSLNVVEHCQQIIYKFDYFALLPTIEITDVFCGEHLFGKTWLWKLLNIDELNQTLKEMRPNTLKCVDMYAPDEVESTISRIYLTVKNPTKYQIPITLQRKKICSCPLIEVQKGLSCRLYKYSCPHREVLKIQPSSLSLEGRSVEFLQMDLKYCLTGQTTMCYQLFLPENRTIELFVHVRTLFLSLPELSVFNVDCKFNLQSVSISELEPCAQVFWLYNRSQNSIRYCIDTKPLRDLYYQVGFEVLKCLNPQEIVEPWQQFPVIFNFKPIELGLYKVNLDFLLGNKRCLLEVSGSSTVDYCKPANQLTVRCPTVSQHLPINALIKLSTEYIVLTMPVTSIVERLFFMNNTSGEVIGYNWHCFNCAYPEMVHIVVCEHKGYLKPGEVRTMRLRIYSRSMPCIIDKAVVRCEVINFTHRRNYEKSVNAYKRALEKMTGEFTITEKGVSYPKPKLTVLEAPQVHYIALTVSCVVKGSLNIDIRDLKTTHKQCRHIPNFETLPEIEEISSKIGNDKFASCAKNTLEKILRSVVTSENFTQNIQEISNQKMPYYTQLQALKMFKYYLREHPPILPPDTTIVRIISHLITQCTFAYFSLGHVYQGDSCMKHSKWSIWKRPQTAGTLAIPESINDMDEE